MSERRPSDENFLSRWSRKKTAARAGRDAPVAEAVPAQAGVPSPASSAPSAPSPTPLPPVESLGIDSDFTPFLREGVDEHLKRAALKTLFQDPRFNVMDGLDVYIDDYSKPDPLPEGWLEKLNQVARLGEYREPEPEEKAQGEAEAEGASPDVIEEAAKTPSESDTPVPPESLPPVSES